MTGRVDEDEKETELRSNRRRPIEKERNGLFRSDAINAIAECGRIIVGEPFLIMELNRFVPYLEGTHVKFHPLNMPNIKIGKIEIMGFVVGVSEIANFYEYQIDDGTGTITIFYDKQHFQKTIWQRQEIDKKYNTYVKNIDIKVLKFQELPKRMVKPRPKFNYPDGTNKHDIAILEHNWALETNNGKLGKKVKRCEYIHAVGYCTLDFLNRQKPTEEITFSDLSNAKLNFLANEVTNLSEHQYNEKFISWMKTVVRRRYDNDFKWPASSSK
ncbi:hypothetical protein WN48_10864 [Eufriesea mexicana]|uniref:Uncharacterized protein n=1 Tax=Eufriesea mexicana TaxID=516756 RepID=A0A310SHY4_9HYME|nr:hypothetical protein WN48_10864 [Eufriesea mexicana]